MTSDKTENVQPDPEDLPQATPEDADPGTSDEIPEPEPAPETYAGEEPESGSSDEFAALLESTEQKPPTEARVGDKVSGTIIQISDTDAFVDCGLRQEIPISLNELKDKDGNVGFKVGDQIKGHLAKGQEGLILTRGLDLRNAGGEALRGAFESGTPVEGKVGATNKGGFSIDVGGTRAFCPFSQIDVRRVQDPEQFVGQKLQFKILELSEDGRNIVVSRRAILQADRESAAAETRNTLALGDEREGTVTRLVPFGAFVDIGGVEGLVHISQISHQRVGDPSDVLSEGQTVRVKVLEIQNLGMGRSERISLSIKVLASDPWPETANSLAPGTDVTGKVTRLVDFGVFVELKPGVEGLIHISELANRRIMHPREVLNEDEEISVRILDVDLQRRRISLSRRQSGEYDGD